MRRIVLAALATVAGIAAVAPASAQYYPAPQRHGFNDSQSAFRSLQARISRLKQQIRELDNRGLLTSGQARQRYNESRIIEGQLYGMARDGFSRREASELERGLTQFERQVWADTNGGRGWDSDRYDRW